MILYFDSYITDIPLNSSTSKGNDNVRASCRNYAMPSKVDIAKYTLASYSEYDWDHVLIKYEVDDLNDYEVLDKFILDLYPSAIILHKRGDSFAEFQKSLEIINSFANNWIFYTGDNDQPFIGNHLGYIDDLISIASNYESEFQYVSIACTHFSESLSLGDKNSPMNLRYGRDIINIENNSKAKVILRKQGDNTSTQIVNKNLLNYWFSSKSYPNERVIRSEDVRYLFLTNNQLIVLPKEEICAHFDGYSHTQGTNIEIMNYQIPPLFIPQGFFTDNIKICYGYDDYRDGLVNINPIKKKYIFEHKNGVDLKTELDKLPLFWDKKISELDINININQKKLKKRIKQNNRVIKKPWSLFNRSISLGTGLFFVRYLILFFWVRSFLIKLTHTDNERREITNRIVSFLKLKSKNL